MSAARYLAIVLIIALSTGPAHALDNTAVAARPRASRPEREEARTSRFHVPYRDSEVLYRNVVSARSFNRRADLTYNPYYAMELELSPVFWLNQYLYSTLDVSLVREFTRADTTTKGGETVLQDIYLAFGSPGVVTIPVVNIEVTPTVRFYVPSSKVSRARTLILAIRPRIGLSRRFDVLDGLIFSYGMAFMGNLHESTTAECEAPLIDVPPGSTRSEESFTNLGVRNTRFSLSNTVSLDLGVASWIGMRLMVSIIHGFLYRLGGDERISYEPQEPTDVRYMMAYNGEVYIRPRRFLTVALGFITENYQLAPDSTYEAPFFNRYTAPYLDLRVDVAALSKKVKKAKKKRGRK